MMGMKGTAGWARRRHLESAPGPDGKRPDDLRQPLTLAIVVRATGRILIGLGLFVFFGMYLVGFLLGGGMVFTGGIFWPPIYACALGALLVFLASKIEKDR